MVAAKHIEQLQTAPIDQINEACRALEAAGKSVINLGQAVSFFGPPPEAIAQLGNELTGDDIHRYTADPGLQSLRSAVASYIGCGVLSDEIIVTAGANHGFSIAAQTLLGPGDRCGLLTPYFLNHKMALEAINAKVVEIHPDADMHYSLSPELLQTLKVLVLVNPSNPTGKIFKREELEAIVAACIENDVFIIVDEVYRDFVPEGQHVCIESLADCADNTMSVGSFSKSFGMTGWRVGWLRTPPALVEHLLKVQDYSLICAPHASQLLAEISLSNHGNWVEQHWQGLMQRREAALSALAKANIEIYTAGKGGFFLWLRPHQQIDSMQEVYSILDEQLVCTMPGEIFGNQFKHWIRLSFGSQSTELVGEGCLRLAKRYS